MSTVNGILSTIELLGGRVWLDGDAVRCRVPRREADALVESLRQHRDELVKIVSAAEVNTPAVDVDGGVAACQVHGASATWWLCQDGSAVCGLCHPDPFALAARESAQIGPPIMPRGVKLLAWEPKAPPVALSVYSVVSDTGKFIVATLQQLDAALRGNGWTAGNWGVRDLVERLEQVGVRVEVHTDRDGVPCREVRNEQRRSAQRRPSTHG